MLQINQSIWHPCSTDIIEHKVVAIHQYEKTTEYTLKAVRNVGACGRVEVIVRYSNGKYLFVELVDEDDILYANGLQDFVGGLYYPEKEQARIAFYSIQERNAYSNMLRQETLYKESIKRYEQVMIILKEIRSSLGVVF
jgi:hypothetical protein